MPFVDLLELTGAVALLRLFDVGLDDDLQGAASTGSRSRTCGCAAPGRKASGRRRSASCSARRRASTRSSTIPARTTARRRRLPDNATVRANCIAAGRSGRRQLSAGQPADLGDHRRQRGSRAGNVEELGARRASTARRFLPRLLDRGQLVQDQDRGRDPGDRRRRSRSASCVVNNRSAGLRAGHPHRGGPDRADRGRAAEHRRHRDRRASTSTSPTAPPRPAIGTFGFTWNNTFLRNYDVIVPTAERHRR